MEKQRAMGFGFWKTTTTAVIKPDGWMDR